MTTRRIEPGARPRRAPGAAGRQSVFAKIYRAVRTIPRGRVATYGQIARLAGVPRGARTVGWALRALSPRAEPRVPWHRVVGAGGLISLPEGNGGEEQRARLRVEGIRFRHGRIDLARFGI